MKPPQKTFGFLALLASVLAARDVLARTDICYLGGAPPPSFKLNGSARLDGTELLVTPASTDMFGSIFSDLPLASTGDVHVELKVRISDNKNGNEAADGMAFVMHQDPRGTSAIGEGGEGMCYGRYPGGTGQIKSSLIVEMDTYQNNPDPDANHIGIMKDGENETHLALYSPLFDMKSGIAFYVWVDYTASATKLEVFVSKTGAKPASSQLSYPINLATKFNSKPFYIGFTGSTGGWWSKHAILGLRASDAVSTPSVCCTDDTHCTASNLGPACDLVKHVCGECTPSLTYRCGVLLSMPKGCDISGASNRCILLCTGDLGSAGPAVCTSAAAPACLTSGSTAGSCAACNGHYGSNATRPCGARAPSCSFSTGYCHFCRSSADCGGLSCNAPSGSCSTCDGNFGSSAPRPCPTSGSPYCNLLAGVCSKTCQRDLDCGSSPWCFVSGGTSSCEPRLANGESLPSLCTPSLAVRACAAAACDVADNMCGVALGNGPCGANMHCRSGVCVTSGPNRLKCKACNTASDCSGATPACTDNSCAACDGNFVSSAKSPCPVAAYPFCDLGTGTCNSNCQKDSDCGSGKWCSALGCQAILPNGGRIPEVCTPLVGSRACASGACDVADNMCGVALGNGTCSSSTQCRSGVCVTSGPNNGKCKTCNSANDCPGATPACTDNSCAACDGNFGSSAKSPCPVAAFPFCDLGTGTCNSNCQKDSDCGSGKWCSALGCQAILPNGGRIPEVCTPLVGSRACASGACDVADNMCGVALGNGTCSSSTQCRSGVCVTSGPNNGKCKVCNAGSDCSGATPVCADNSCSACNGNFGSSAKSPCPAFAYTFCNLGSGTCNATCQKDSDCGSVKWCSAMGCQALIPNGALLLEPCTPLVGSRACASGACDVADNMCGLALGNGTCMSSTQCRLGVCVTSGPNIGKCKACNIGSDCSGATPVCTGNACAACDGNFGATAKSPCPSLANAFCNLGAGTCNYNCQKDSDCGPGKWCSGMVGCQALLPNGARLPEVCTPLVGGRACASGACDVADNMCGLALGNGICSSSTQCRLGVCVTSGPNTGKCKVCGTGSDCSGATPACTDNSCAACDGNFGAAAKSPCPASAAPFCNLGTGTCHGACQKDSDCGTGKRCSAVAGDSRCVELAGPDAGALPGVDASAGADGPVASADASSTSPADSGKAPPPSLYVAPGCGCGAGEAAGGGWGLGLLLLTALGRRRSGL